MNAPEILGGFTHCKFWTPLPPLQLRGLGTSLVESLPHYCARLAWTSGVSLINLNAALMETVQQGKGYAGGFTALCGPGTSYLASLAIVEAATGNITLRHGTFWALHRILGRTGLNRHPEYRRWCPACIWEWDEDTSCEPLIWNISLLASCPEHGCDLLDVCPTCGAKQRVFSRYDSLLRCRKCQSSLGAGEKFTDRPRFMRWVESQLCDLVKLCATPGQQPLSSAAYQRFTSRLDLQVRASKLMPKSLAKEVARLRKSAFTQRPSIRTLLNLAAMQGVPICQIFLDPDAASSQPLLDVWQHFDYLPLPRSMGPDKPRRAAACLEKVLEQLSETYIPPMGASVLLQLVVVRRVIQEAYPELYKRYDTLYIDQAPVRLRNRLRSAFGYAVRQVKVSKRRSGKPLNSRALARLLRENTHVEFAWVGRVALAAIVCDRIVTEVAKAKIETLPPLPHSLGWQQTCGMHLL